MKTFAKYLLLTFFIIVCSALLAATMFLLVKGYMDNPPSTTTSTTTSAHSHEWVKSETTLAATCTTDGEKTQTCACGERAIQIISAPGHNYVITVTDPTCTEKGYTTYKCSACEDSYVDNYIDATGHDLDDWTTLVPATCTKDGEERRDCKSCEHYETQTIKAIGHDYDSVVTDPTCSERGYTTHTCANCEDMYIDSYVRVTDHTDDGTGVCVDCGKPCDHIHSYTVKSTDEKYLASSATCNAPAVYFYSCACGVIGIETFKHGTALGHDNESETVSASCTENGYSYNVCSRCGYESITTIYATGHKISNYDSYIEASCESNGSCSGYCDSCNEYITTTISATGHIASEITFSDKYCGTQKLGHSSCTVCKEVIAEFGHFYKETVTQPTCTENGEKVYTCVHCDDSYSETISALGHFTGEWTVKTEATCTEEGEYVRYCTTCNEVADSTNVAKTEHTYESTTSASGITYTCADCNDSYFVEAVEYVTISFMCDGEKIYKDIQIPKGTTATLPSFSKEGFILDGWYLDEELTNLCLTSYVYELDTTLYSAWRDETLYSETNSNNLVTDAPISYAFSVTSTVPLTNANLSDYIFITDIDENKPTLSILSEKDGVYTIGSEDYESGATYQVIIRDEVTFTEIDGKEHWFITVKENEYNVTYQDGTVFIHESDLYACHEDEENTFIFMRQDKLNAGDNVVIYGDDIYDALIIIEIVAEGTFENLHVYQVKSAEFDDIFAEYDCFYSGELDVDNMEFDAELEEVLIKKAKESNAYARIERAAATFSGVTIGDYYYDENGVHIKPVFKASGKTITVGIDIEVRFDRMDVDTRKVVGVLSVTMRFTTSMSVNVTFDAKNLDNFTIATEVRDKINYNFFVSITDSYGPDDNDKVTLTDLTFFKNYFEKALSDGKFTPVDSNYASKDNDTTLGVLPVNVCGLTFSVKLSLWLEFDAVGAAGFGLELDMTAKVGIQRTQGKIKNISSFNSSASVTFYLLGKIDVAYLLKLEGSVSFLGSVNAYINIYAGPYFEAGGLISAKFSTTGVNSYATYGYMQAGLKLGSDVGLNIKLNIKFFGWRRTLTLYDEKWNIMDERLPFFTIGDPRAAVPMYFDKTKESITLDCKCGTEVNISGLVDNTMVVQDFDSMKTKAQKASCEFFLNGDYKGVSISKAGHLTVKGDLTNTVISIKMVHKNIYKIVEVKVNFSHEEVNVPYLSPTCTEKGHTAYSYCKGCNKILSGKNDPIRERGHDLSEWTVVTAVTCTSNGSQKRTCSRCNYSETQTVNATGHRFTVQRIEDKYLKSAATCTASAVYYYSCNACAIKGSTTFSYGNALGHNYKSVVTAPTCTTGGYTTHTCQRCNDTYKDGSVATTGHNLSAWNTTVLVTCTVNGEEKRECSKCEYFETKVISATGHNYASVVTAPTCTAQGYTTHTCSKCNNIYIDAYKAALGHSYNSVVTEPTCISRGYTTHTCSKCNDSYVDNYIEMLDHVDNGSGICPGCGNAVEHFHSYPYETVSDACLASATSCTSPAKYYYSCICGKPGTETFEYGKPLGHNYSSSLTSPTCTERGYTTHTCSRCNDTYDDTYVNATGHNYKTVVTAPNCTEQGYTTHTCSKCNDSYADNYIEMLDHIDDGSGICPDCGCKVEHFHSYIYDIVSNNFLVSAANCTEPAIYYYSCICGKPGVQTFIYGSPLGHSFKEGGGICLTCGFEKAGLHDEYGNLIATWDELVSTYGMNVSRDYSNQTYKTNPASPYIVLKNSKLTSGVKLVISNVNKIGAYAFYNSSQLTSITIPDSVTSIGDCAFSSCTSLTSITLPDSVTSIGGSAFYYCTSLTSITIPDSVTSIGGGAFEYCIKLTSITIPSGVTRIPSEAFSSCVRLTSITIPNSVTSIGKWAFNDCTRLTSITLPDSVTSIDDYAFQFCSKLVEVYNLSSLPIAKGSDEYGGIGKYALNVYTPTEGNSKLKTSMDGFVFYEDGKVCYLIEYVGNDTTIVLPNKFNGMNYAIYTHAFVNCHSLTSITIPNSITSIGENAFSSCINLTSVTIGNSVTSIGSRAFSNCDSLTSVTIPDSVTSIGNDAFENCTSLTNITIGNSVTSIGNYAFDYCTSLTSITFKGTTSKWNAITKGSNWNKYVLATAVQCSDGVVKLS